MSSSRWGVNLLPPFDCPDGHDADSYVRQLCLDGISKRYGAITPEITERLDFELSTISRMGYSAYFLITWDWINWAKSQGIPVGPGRGSAAGSIVAYALRITEIDPLKYDLLFERFLNPDRVSMPDIDTDVAQYGRDSCIKYLTEKYGAERVAQVSTFGKMQPKAAVKDAPRVIDLPRRDRREGLEVDSRRAWPELRQQHAARHRPAQGVRQRRDRQGRC